jgi:hypothetical protein
VVDWYDNFEFPAFRHPLYPSMAVDKNKYLLTGEVEYGSDFLGVIEKGSGLEEFVNRGGHTSLADGGYVPFADFLGPYLWFPMHCVPIPERGIFKSPLIAYVRNDTNEI